MYYKIWTFRDNACKFRLSIWRHEIKKKGTRISDSHQRKGHSSRQIIIFKVTAFIYLYGNNFFPVQFLLNVFQLFVNIRVMEKTLERGVTTYLACVSLQKASNISLNNSLTS